MRRSALIAATALLLGVSSGTAPAEATPANDSSTVSLNHAGYAVDDTDVRHVHAQWVQPAVKCGATTTYANFLVGLSQGGTPLARVGTSAECHSGRLFDYAWLKLPEGSRHKISRRVDAGDHLSASVDITNDGQVVQVALSNNTRLWGLAVAESTMNEPTRAVILVQARSGINGVLPLTRSTVVFAHCKVDGHVLPGQHPKRFVLQNSRDIAKPSTFAPAGRFLVVST